jgi:hypothetical protein
MRRREARLLQRQIELPLCSRRLARPRLERLDRGIDGERLQDPQHLRADGVIGIQAAERDAPPGAVVHASALAVITACLATIAHVHFATAMSAAQKPRQQQLSAPHRPSDQGPLLRGL